MWYSDELVVSIAKCTVSLYASIYVCTLIGMTLNHLATSLIHKEFIFHCNNYSSCADASASYSISYVRSSYNPWCINWAQQKYTKLL